MNDYLSDLARLDEKITGIQSGQERLEKGQERIEQKLDACRSRCDVVTADQYAQINSLREHKARLNGKAEAQGELLQVEDVHHQSGQANWIKYGVFLGPVLTAIAMKLVEKFLGG